MNERELLARLIQGPASGAALARAAGNRARIAASSSSSSGCASA
jgi:hypothetical protein